MLGRKKIRIDNKLLIGRHEWCQLPDLNVPAIKAKIDTGAKTSAIHAFNIKPIIIEDQEYVNFDIHPIQGNEATLVTCQAPVLDRRHIMSSNGHREYRYVIITSLKISDQYWRIELTLSNRDPLRFRMLLGREALSKRVLIDPSMACIQGKLTRKAVMKLY